MLWNLDLGLLGQLLMGSFQEFFIGSMLSEKSLIYLEMPLQGVVFFVGYIIVFIG
jgi:hypothetical protein